MVETHLNVTHLAGLFGRYHVAAGVLGELLNLLLAEGREIRSADFAINEPVVTAVFVG